MDSDGLVELYWPIDFLEADAIRQALHAEGIPVHLDGENLTAQAGSSAFGNTGRCRMRLMVRARDAEQAMRIINRGNRPNYTPG